MADTRCVEKVLQHAMTHKSKVVFYDEEWNELTEMSYIIDFDDVAVHVRAIEGDENKTILIRRDLIGSIHVWKNPEYEVKEK